MARRVSWPWLLIMIAMIMIIWGNSMVPGTGSSNISETVMRFIQGALASCGLPWQWVTNFIVRKTAHFTEYMVLGIITTHAFDNAYARGRSRLLLIAAVLVLTPSIDETIQLFVSGRSGQPTDVLLDCCGAATGVLVSYGVVRPLRAFLRRG